MRRNVSKLLYLARTRDRSLGRLIRRWVRSDGVGVGIARPLDTPVQARRPRVPLTIRPMTEKDEPAFTDPTGLSEAQAINRLDARRIIDSGIRTFYVAVTEDDEPVFMQALILPSSNDRFDAAFGGMVPPLKPDEAMIDFAFTLEEHRATGAMPWTLAHLSELAREAGAKQLLAWLPEENIAMNRFFRRVGFKRIATRHERYWLGRRRISFEPYEGPEPESAYKPGAGDA